MLSTDMDRLQTERVNKLMAKVFEGDDFSLEEFFISGRAIETIDSNKIFLSTYRQEKVLSILPFTPVVYTTICPHCINNENLSHLDLLISSGLVLPILMAPYKSYDGAVREFFAAREHISCYEFSAYRFVSLALNTERMLCEHCADLKINEISKAVESRKNAANYLNGLRRIVDNVEPFFGEDESLIELTLEACRKRKLNTVRQIAEASEILREIRTAQSFCAPVMLDETTLSHLPENVTADIDYALVNTGKLREAAAEGLKISIPTNVPLEAYIELVKDSQPRISEVIDLTLSKAPAEASLLDVSKNVSSINLEIEKLRSTRRYAVFDASMAFYRNNNSLINAALVAGAFGMAGSLFGTCATALGAAGKNIAKKKGWLKDNPSANRLGRMIAQDLQPYTDRMMQVFLGGNAPAVNVLSLRRRIETSTTRLVSKKCKVAAAR